ncbi:MAG: UPF0175 family protein [Candidatus Heimdallarchaeum aukensis]|uniref:UPF0175 family protein n=1 Tax=Candidatus Heimdallarchaeum aukensis TaxID=2876573 RepID=A0A9Y1BJZ6_9ARCH|nr:MAG: UPF0175 family protein [Candidatus Heimdallarchaeum aukensis]
MSSYYLVNEKEFIYILAFLYKYLKRSKEFINSIFFQKAIFFLSRDFHVLEEKLVFRPHRFGPHSYKLEKVLDLLINEEILKEKIQEKDKIFFLTEYGKRLGKEAFDLLTEKEQNVIDWIVDQLVGLTLDELLALVYYTYEYMTVNSEIKKEIDSKRKKLALSLFRKEKITFERASEIAGVSKDGFKKIIKN